MTPNPPITIVGGSRKKAEIPPMPKIPWRAVGIGFALLAALLFLRDCFVLVQAGERAAVYSKLSGVKHYQLGEGLHFIWPLVYEPTIYDTKTLTYTMSGGANEGPVARHQLGADRQVQDDSIVALTSDGLPVTLDLSVRFRIDENAVWRLHQEIGPDFVDKIVRPQTRAVTRMAFAQFPVTDVYSGKRQLIVEQVQKELRDELAKSYMILDEVLLRDIRFQDSFQNAIEQKQVAQQQAQQMVYELQRADSEKQRRIIEAEGEATAIRKKADALTAHPQLVQYEYVQRLPQNPRVIVTDSKSILSLGDLMQNLGAPASPAGTPGQGPGGPGSGAPGASGASGGPGSSDDTSGPMLPQGDMP